MFLYPKFIRRKTVEVSPQELEERLLPFSYYESLSGPGKSTFLKRILLIRSVLKFEGMNGLQINEEMKIRICASMVQLSLRFSKFILPAFRRVLVYPERFYHAGWKKWMKGFTSGNGVVALSWNDFQHGYAVEDDNYNLGLHELAHALHVNLQAGYTSDPVFEHYFIHWTDKSYHEFQNISKNADHFLRQYGGTNIHEFFAVCVEHFFESPNEFQKALPDLFDRTKLLLNQDPLNQTGDYALDESSIRIRRSSQSFSLEEAEYRQRSWHWSLTLSFIGIFISPIIILVGLIDALVFPINVVKMVVAISLIGFVQYPIFKRRGWFDYMLFFVMYCIAGVGINGVALGVVINRVLAQDTHVEQHEVARQEPNGANHDIVYLAEPNKYDKYGYELSVANSYGRITQVTIELKDGFFGIQHVESVRVLQKERIQ